MNDSDIFLGLLAILFPPFPVWVKRGIFSADSLINICLCALGGVPGILHAWYIISQYPHQEQGGSSDAESARITRYVVIHEPRNSVKASTPSPQPYTGYGATATPNPSGPVEGTNNITGLPSYQEAIKSSYKVQSNI